MKKTKSQGALGCLSLVKPSLFFQPPTAQEGVTILSGSDENGRWWSLLFPLIFEYVAFVYLFVCLLVCLFSWTRRYGKWFKSRMFGKIHVFVPSTEAARKVFTNDFGEFNKSYIKSMATVVGEKSVFAVPLETHKRIRHILSALFSMPSLSKFVEKFDQMISQRLNKLEQTGKSFAVLPFTMKVLKTLANIWQGFSYSFINWIS